MTSGALLMSRCGGIGPAPKQPEIGAMFFQVGREA